MVATASIDGTVRLWEVGREKPVGILELKSGLAWNLAIDPSGSLLIVSFAMGRDFLDSMHGSGKIKIFDMTSLQEASPTVEGLDHSYDRLQFRLRKDGRVAFGIFDQRTWDMRPDQRPTGDLIKLTRMYTQKRLDGSGDLVPLRREELQALWRQLHAKYPEEFTASPKAAVEWRIRQLQSASRKGNPFAIAFHRRWLFAELSELNWQAGERGNEDMEPNNYLHRLDALALHGRHTDAAMAADALAARWSRDQNILYGCVCVHALASVAIKGDAALAERYAARAVALLRQAVKAGYNNGQHLGKDPDLDALRSREDFRALLKGLTSRKR